MKTIKKSALFFLFALLALIFSCSKEEINSNQVNLNIEKEINESKTPITVIAKCPLRIKPTACGHGFTVFVYNYGNPTTPVTGVSVYYQILTIPSAVVVDSGYISHGMNTNWVLSPCTNYTFRIYPCKGNLTYFIDVVAQTDGCGGIFLC